MAATTRIFGRALWLTIGGTDYAADMREAVLSFEKKDTNNLTFGDLNDPQLAPDQGKLKITAVQSLDASSFWMKVWEAVGQTLEFVFAPHGNKTPTSAQPHITGKCVIGVRPNIGGQADPTKPYTFEVEWDCPEVDKTLKKA